MEYKKRKMQKRKFASNVIDLLLDIDKGEMTL